MRIRELAHPSDDTARAFTAAIGINNLYASDDLDLPNLTPIDQGEFWGWRADYSFQAEVSLGRHRLDGKPATWFAYFAGHSALAEGGFAVAYLHGPSGMPQVRYFRWQRCDHGFEVADTGKCQRTYTCTKCGASHSTDSSG